MNAIRIAAIALIVAGVLALVYGGFSYTKETHQAKLGPIEFSVQEKQTGEHPGSAGVVGIVIGGALLLYGGKRNSRGPVARPTTSEPEKRKCDGQS